ncbi:hypothetical protein GCM10007388_37630 [Pseudoduganella plicata]|uniref:Uncharacterized protein n=1 Tax=Pseudoduganella plicata TaxID=321984 RepID=A0AA87Y9R5_9BURK|nr:hypothetical protein GCM10007388_37630 [Pseudoduganella plicata]
MCWSTLQQVGIADFADILAMCLMTIMLDLQDADVAPELVDRIGALKIALRQYNEVRFAAPPSAAI